MLIKFEEITFLISGLTINIKKAKVVHQPKPMPKFSRSIQQLPSTHIYENYVDCK